MTTAMTPQRGSSSSSPGQQQQQQPQRRRRISRAAAPAAAAAAAAMLSLLLLALLLAPASSSASGLPARVIPLTDASFEHDTQASTGQTTGHWAVLLHDSGAVKTRPATASALQALSALAASRDSGGMETDEEEAPDPGCLYASVDASEEANPALAARFRAFLPGPVLLLFRDRQLFPLPLPRVMLTQQQLERAGSGASRSEEQAVSAVYHAVLDFLMGGFREVDSERIPPPSSSSGKKGRGGGGGGGADFVNKAVDFLAAQKAELDGDYLMMAGIATVAVGVVAFIGFFGLAAAMAAGAIGGGGGGGAAAAAPLVAPAAAAAAAAAGKKQKKEEEDAKPAPVLEEVENKEDEAEEVVAKGEEEEEEEEEAEAEAEAAEAGEEEDEQAAGSAAAAAGVRRRRRHA